MEDSGGTTIVNEYYVDLAEVETLLQEGNEHLRAIEGYTVSTVAVAALLVGVVLGIAVARLFYSLWRG